jgi:pseudouridine synthase
MDTTGLLLLTNDTKFGERVASPDGGMAKTYDVLLDRRLADGDASAIRAGLRVANERYRPAVVHVDLPESHSCRLTITEGRNREIRRLFQSVGYRVIGLHRVRIGPVALGNLRRGAVRPLSVEELRNFRSLARKEKDR